MRYIQMLFYQVTPAEPAILAFPSLTMAAVALLAALAPEIHALRTDPATMLRTE